MTMLTVRNLDPAVKAQLRERAARHGRSMEAEVRQILADAVAGHSGRRSVAEAFAAGFPDGTELDIPDRTVEHRPVDL